MDRQAQNKIAAEFNASIVGQMQEICHPLFTNYGVSLFEYIRVFPDGTCLNISSNQSWLVKNYTKCPTGTLLRQHLKKVPMNTTRYIPYGYSMEELKNPMLQEAFNSNIWNGMYVYKKYKNYCECFVVASTPDNSSIMEFYMNERPIIEKFVHYFREKIEVLIDLNSKSNRISLTENLQRHHIESDEETIRAKALKSNKYTFHLDEKEYFLTRREAQCLGLAAYGKTAKEIGHSLGISARTVEKHLESIKLKTQLFYKSDLIDFFHANNQTREVLKIYG